MVIMLCCVLYSEHLNSVVDGGCNSVADIGCVVFSNGGYVVFCTVLWTVVAYSCKVHNSLSKSFLAVRSSFSFPVFCQKQFQSV